MAAKIARLDYPVNKWPGLLSGLMEIIRVGAEKRFSLPAPDESALLQLRRALGMLNSILKEFHTMKSPAGTQTNNKVCEVRLIPIIFLTWFLGNGRATRFFTRHILQNVCAYPAFLKCSSNE
jgi:hypothetical protein